ncbi:flagellar motor switch protein FliM [Phaeobacter sp. CECT 5382]|uniref:FliM/FliN family flagellar motor switch protein n=1 Tax=Rhodobacterales TaxID=204455 RepID=UPI0006DB4DBC|nr:FliM/FliN family flagellar motor C-terminal domain-containing protein [Phaeobacter sp. CECT 5382]CUH86172.1 flagellar motor switch protein FliM [Phaeobacter sp. CECT 5382]
MSEAEKEQGGSDKPSGLARKLAASKEGKGNLNASHTLKALRRSLARAASEQCDLPLAVLAARQSNRIPEDLAEVLSDKDLLVVLDGPGGRIGAVTMDAPLVTALIQKQTIGQVMGKAPSERNYTPTDAAMTSEFLEKAFGKVVAMLDGQKDQLIFSGYRFGAQIEDVRSLALGLEAEDYRLITLNVDLAIGAMQGVMNLILPEPTPEDLGLSGGPNGPSLGSNLGAMRAELSAVLCKVRVPLNEFSKLKVGEMLPLDQAFLYETDLISIGGQSIAQGRLGQMNGARAVRLNEGYGKETPALLGADAAFADGVGAEMPAALPPMDEPAPLDLGIAAQDLQDPLDDGMGLPPLGGMDPAGGLEMGDMGDMGGLGGDLGGDFGGGLGGGLGMDSAPMGDLPALGDLPSGVDPLGGADDLGGLMDPLGGEGFDQFNPDDAAAEISKLAGLEGDAAQGL